MGKNRVRNVYENVIRDKLPAIQGWARNGLTNEQIAKNLGIHPATLYKYQKEKPELKEAIKKGKEVVDFEVENALLKRALGYTVEEVKREWSEKDGEKITTTEKHIPPDVGAAAFWLKNRKPNDWRDKREVSTDTGSGANITFNIVPASQRQEESEDE